MNKLADKLRPHVSGAIARGEKAPIIEQRSPIELPKVCAKPPKSYNGAVRQICALLRVYSQATDGGGSFGMDERTLQTNWPEGYAKYKELCAARLKLVTEISKKVERK